MMVMMVLFLCGGIFMIMLLIRCMLLLCSVLGLFEGFRLVGSSRLVVFIWMLWLEK